MATIPDEMSGESGARTVMFGFEGYIYLIDLAQTNTDRLAQVLDPFIAKARVVKKPSRSRRRPDPQARMIRAWAREQGMTVADRGRMPTDVIAAYRAAHTPGGCSDG